ncbi:MAG: alpha-glucan phosphorylase [Syntrophaceae bacterium CG2_30_49_12]|nr:MAG: alpha-glucan phosphorylase [Syntrophaceae bacterium CG2_30_49_12]PIP07809.1 MAG: alpha-glucan phosphorylase [Syntrophobacterales bacterium CG23_combo_of_CG06-09_8_20_14_all_48_27]PJC73189.1 MAG: alpha-glucan phosphorylase [Syntrophobacterales bacterium CG_4_8_14_3_um_filter_49_14]
MKIKQGVFPHLPERLSGLEALSMNLWWSWHPAARMLFKTLDRQAWKESGHNPVKMLKEIPVEILASAAENPEYLHQYDLVMEQLNQNIHSAENYFSRSIVSNRKPVAFFSAEYGLHHSLPFYAGGLGFLAGDFVKECCDMKVPIVAIGFMYPEGYFRQRIRDDGWQENMDQALDRDAASISRVLKKEDGEHLAIKVPLIEPPIHVAVWRISIGCVSLYLMDTDIEMNDPWNRQMSAHLYIGDIEQRLRQEIVLGIGGSEILDTLGIRHSLLHLNEGHCAFALLERIRDRVQGGMNYEDAVQEVRATTIFTTHTPVAAGHEIFPFPMIEKYFRSYWPSLGLDRDSFLQLGIHPGEPHAGFNMTALALKLSAYHNGVSRRHQEVARQMWQSLWPDLPPENVPIDYVTNGIHVPTWIEPKMELLFNRYLGPQWLQEHDNPAVWDRIDEIPDKELWQTHYWLKMKLINAIRERARRRWLEDRTSTTTVLAMGAMLDPSILTIGFARRFATYKRAELILYNMERLKKLLKSRWRPIQIIFAGKAHPADDPGKRILQRVFNTARDPEMGGRIAFLEDYGEQFAQYLVHGVDVWLNNPLPPLEACGTSGMKAALNGVLHLSILDGWWVEGFNGKNGWAFGEGETGADRDGADAEALYQILEEKIIPLYYKVSSDGIPTEWVKMMKETIKSNASRFSARRMVKDYIEKFYLPALSKEEL